jgi:hypothetical protein
VEFFFQPHYALGFYSGIFLGVKRGRRKADNLTAVREPIA